MIRFAEYSLIKGYWSLWVPAAGVSAPCPKLDHPKSPAMMLAVAITVVLCRTQRLQYPVSKEYTLNYSRILNMI